ncbi:Centrosomal protein of 76 kDa (Cep76) [Durusdinium trenchii]|uniref:Centrosomal protein of 76 kDa (Cep76) n=1 Tax=Durusdinium trenchii TaxID=1381693 RepID=A0ABP0L5G0_9DINO
MGQLGDSMESEAVDTDGRAGTGTGGFRTVAFHAERGRANRKTGDNGDEAARRGRDSVRGVECEGSDDLALTGELSGINVDGYPSASTHPLSFEQLHSVIGTNKHRLLPPAAPGRSFANDWNCRHVIPVVTPRISSFLTRACLFRTPPRAPGAPMRSTRRAIGGGLGVRVRRQVNLMSFEKPRELQELVTQLGGGSRYHVILANAEIPLRGVLEHGEVKAELRSGAAKRGEEWGVCGEPIWMGFFSSTGGPTEELGKPSGFAGVAYNFRQLGLATLRPAPWFYGLEEGGKVHRQRCGLLQGHVAVDHRPRYQQTDDVSDELDLRKRYLFVKVIKVDRVVTPDTRPTDEIDTFVEVTFDGVAKRTRICQDDVSPSFNNDLVFELSLAKTSSKNERQDDNEATWEELERKGPVFIDLWTIGSKSNEHLGSVEAFLQDILVDEVGQPQKEVTRTARDARLKRQENFSVRAFRGQRRLFSHVMVILTRRTSRLQNPLPSGRAAFAASEQHTEESNIFYEMWFLPDLDPMAVLKALPAEVPLPKALAEKFEEKQMIWNLARTNLDEHTDEVADELNGIHENMEQIEQDELRRTGRQFQCTAASIWPVQSAQEHFLPRFCDVLRPPHGVDCATAINHYVGCFPYMESKSEDTVSTPNFFCALRKGKILEHALLHCSLLLGLSFKAYVCCGTNLKGDAHSWVAVFEEDGTVRFWEPFLGTGTLQLRRRFAHPQYLLPGPSNKPARSMKDADLQAEERRRRRGRERSVGQ